MDSGRPHVHASMQGSMQHDIINIDGAQFAKTYGDNCKSGTICNICYKSCRFAIGTIFKNMLHLLANVPNRADSNWLCFQKSATFVQLSATLMYQIVPICMLCLISVWKAKSQLQKNSTFLNKLVHLKTKTDRVKSKKMVHSSKICYICTKSCRLAW